MNTEHENSNLFERAKKRDRFWIETAIIEFTEEITARMGTLDMKKTELAARLKVKPAFITKLLSGSNNFTIETMVKTSRALDADLRVHLQPRGSTSQWFDVLKEAAAHPQPVARTWGTDGFAKLNVIPLQTNTSHEPVRATA